MPLPASAAAMGLASNCKRCRWLWGWSWGASADVGGSEDYPVRGGVWPPPVTYELHVHFKCTSLSSACVYVIHRHRGKRGKEESRGVWGSGKASNMRPQRSRPWRSNCVCRGHNASPPAPLPLFLMKRQLGRNKKQVSNETQMKHEKRIVEKMLIDHRPVIFHLGCCQIQKDYGKFALNL